MNLLLLTPDIQAEVLALETTSAASQTASTTSGACWRARC